MTESEADGLRRLAETEKRVSAATDSAGRRRDDVALLAISKTRPAAAIEPFLAAGHRVFGENRVQEAQQKWPPLKDAYPDCELHLVGPLQSNKAKEAVALFDVIHTLDREKLARKLAALRAEMQAEMGGETGGDAAGFPALFVQVNTGNEPQKSGIEPAQLAAFLGLCRDELGLPIAGLMCLPPIDEAPGPHFALLGKLAAKHDIQNLSMGMSGDFETAIALGATHIRLGTVLFGAR